MRFLTTCIAILTLVACQTTTSETSTVTSKYQALAPVDFAKQLAMTSGTLLDVRTPKEYQAGALDNAQNMNIYNKTFKKDCQQLDKTKPIFVYCQRGSRSAKAANTLLELGFQEVYDLEGGYADWTQTQQ